MRYCVISDIHGHLIDVPECDAVIISGDICPVWNHDLLFQKKWLEDDFTEWAKRLPAKHGVFFTWGNHDLIAQKAPELLPDWYNYPEDNLEGMTFGLISDSNFPEELFSFSSYSPNFGNGWAFNLSDPELHELYKEIYEYTTILVSHGPPYGYGDLSPYGNEHVGSKALLSRMKALPNLKAVICGHIHHAYGEYDCDGIKVINASIVNESYKPVNKPIILEI